MRYKKLWIQQLTYEPSDSKDHVHNYVEESILRVIEYEYHNKNNKFINYYNVLKCNKCNSFISKSRKYNISGFISDKICIDKNKIIINAISHDKYRSKFDTLEDITILHIYDLKQHLEYLDEVIKLEHYEWGINPEEDLDNRLERKKERTLKLLNNKSFCKLLLVDDNNNLIGFISLLPEDGEKEKSLTPWLGTIYVKKEYRGNEYSSILFNALLYEARIRGFKEVYLKSELENFYEKLKAIYIKHISDKEKLYKYDLTIKKKKYFYDED